MSIEQTIIAGLLNNDEFCKKAAPFVQEEYFSNRPDRAVFREIKSFMDKYKGVPTKEALLISLEGDKSLTDDEIKRCRDITDAVARADKQDTQWLLDTTEKFCKDKALYNAVLESIHIIDGKDKVRTPNALPEILSKALSVSFDTNIGHDYLENYEERYEVLHREEDKIPFDLEMFNLITKGGVSPKTFNVIMAGTGVGKSLFMCHHAACCLMQNKNVLYITLEMAEERIAERIDANIMDITMDELHDLPLEMYEKRLQSATRGISGKLIIKEYPTSVANANHFRILMDELKLKKGFIPDIVFIDYINICSSARLKSGGSNVNSYSYIKAIAEELRGLAMERNVPLFTATQVNRSGYSSTDVELTDTSESFGLPHTADFMAALITTEELEKAGQIMVKQLKNRYNTKAANKKFIVGLNYAKMKFYDVSKDEFEDLTDAKTTKEEGFGSGFGKREFTKKFGGSKDTSDWNF
jgi:replicative DNA helicase